MSISYQTAQLFVAGGVLQTSTRSGLERSPSLRLLLTGDQTFGAKWVTELALPLRVFDRLGFTVAETTSRISTLIQPITPNTTRGIYIFDASSSTWGINGAYYYVKASYDLGFLRNPLRRREPAIRSRSERLSRVAN